MLFILICKLQIHAEHVYITKLNKTTILFHVVLIYALYLKLTSVLKLRAKRMLLYFSFP